VTALENRPKTIIIYSIIQTVYVTTHYTDYSSTCESAC
jgi:hypothetical protein